MEWKHTIEAVKQIERERAEGLWRAADELRDLADADLRKCVRDVRARGFQLSFKELRTRKDIAIAFPPDQRRADLSFEIHAAAGTPDMLRFVLDAIEKMNWPTTPLRVGWIAASQRGDMKMAQRLFEEEKRIERQRR